VPRHQYDGAVRKCCKQKPALNKKIEALIASYSMGTRHEVMALKRQMLSTRLAKICANEVFDLSFFAPSSPISARA